MLKEFGQDLKLLRESKNITIAEISAETRINPKFFTNFESGIFDFQPETYVRAFLKEYAKFIQIDEGQILFEYEKAKSGYYDRKFLLMVDENAPEKISQGVMPSIENDFQSSSKDFSSPSLSEKRSVQPDVSYGSNYDSLKSNRKKRFNQKIFLGIIILALIAGIIYLYNYLNKSPGSKQTSDIKPKSFDESYEDYENKIKGRTEKDISDSIKNLTSGVKTDSLTLTVKVAKDVRIKVYLDENPSFVDEIIPAGESLSLKAKEQFKFSAAANASIDLFLNGTLLQKPKTLTGTSIKNLVIRKEGIIQ